MDKYTLAGAAAHLVTAYKAVTAAYLERQPYEVKVGPGAPETYAQLRLDADHGNLLHVGEENSATCIYGVAGNVAFRTMHDLGHLAHDMDFTLASEVALAMHQWVLIAPHIPQPWRAVCHDVYLADTVQQSLYEAKHGSFPKDQTAFVLRCVESLY